MDRTPVLLGDTVVDAVVGYRTWLIEVEQGEATLRSLYDLTTRWPKFEPLHAVCRCRGRSFKGKVFRDNPPGGCLKTCGIYAWAQGIIACTPMPREDWMNTGKFLHGEVALWGEIHVHERGYRAEVAKPTCFYVSDGMDKVKRMLVGLAAIQYGVPLMQIPMQRVRL